MYSGINASIDATTTYVNLSQTALAYLSQDMGIMSQQIGAVANYEQYELKESVIDAVLVTLFSGLFTVLTAVAAYILLWKDIARKANAFMLIGVLVMWLSATVYWVSTLVKVVGIYSDLQEYTFQARDTLTDMLECFWSSNLPGTSNCANSGASFSHPGPQVVPSETAGDPYVLQDCIGTAALTVNVVIGDAIVWWRAWVLWPDNRIVRAICIVTIILTMVMGIVDTKDACRPSSFTVASQDTIGALFSGDVWGIIAVFLSLFTNIAATLLITYRAWEHRRVILSYLKGSSARTQVERTLALLIESGILYCGLWLVTAVYALRESKSDLYEVSSGFTYGFSYVVKGCLVPLIGIYPTLIIIVCAVDKSLNERSAEDAMQNASIVFHAYSSRRQEGTLPDILSVHTLPTMQARSRASGAPLEIGDLDTSSMGGVDRRSLFSGKELAADSSESTLQNFHAV